MRSRSGWERFVPPGSSYYPEVLVSSILHQLKLRASCPCKIEELDPNANNEVRIAPLLKVSLVLPKKLIRAWQSPPSHLWQRKLIVNYELRDLGKPAVGLQLRKEFTKNLRIVYKITGKALENKVGLKSAFSVLMLKAFKDPRIPKHLNPCIATDVAKDQI